MLFLHDVHAAIGEHEIELDEAVRDVYAPTIADDDARLAWYLYATHGAGDGYVVTILLGVATVALAAWLLLRPSGRALATSVVTGVAWLAVYGTLAAVQGGEARVTDTFLAIVGTAIGYVAWTMLGKRTPDEARREDRWPS